MEGCRGPRGKSAGERYVPFGIGAYSAHMKRYINQASYERAEDSKSCMPVIEAYLLKGCLCEPQK